MYALNFQNPWIAGVDAARRRMPAWAAVLGAALIGAGSVVIGGLVWRSLGASRATDGFVIGNLAVFGIMLIATAGAGALEGRSVWRTGRAPLLSLVAGLALGCAGIAAAVALSATFGGVLLHGRPGWSAATGVALGLAVTTFQVSGEEVLFRGWLQPLVGARWGPWLGLAATALLFALLHLVGSGRSLLTLVNLLLAGLTFGLLALRTGGLVAPIAVHAGWNWTEASILGLEPNPGVGAAGAFLDFDCVGPGVWSGGADAMNGALTTTGVLLLMTIVLVALPARRPTAAGAISDQVEPPDPIEKARHLEV